MKEIVISKFSNDLDFELICDGGKENILLSNSSVNRPGLQLYGFYKYFDSDRVQILGKVELSYLKHMPIEESLEKIKKLFTYHFPCLIICWDAEINIKYIEVARKYGVVILKSKMETYKVVSKVMNYLEDYLAPSTSLHGELIEIFGVGVIIQGKSGIGKSETALELIKRGHRLIADDVIVVKQVGEVLTGSAPEYLKQYMEIRGVGLINIRLLYGIGSVKESVNIEMVITLEIWEDGKSYDTLGLENNYVNILDINVPEAVIPVTSGRNIAAIIEVAVKNSRLKNIGINPAKEFFDYINKETKN